MAIDVNIVTQSVPASFCPSNIQTDWPVLVGLLSAQIPGSLNTFVMQNATPDKEDEGKPWYRINDDGTPDKFYVYANGSWLARHPMPPGVITLYMGTETGIKTFDGGEDSDPTLVSGWMWEKLDVFDGRIALGAGNLPVQGLDVAVSQEGGVDQHDVELAEENLPPHTHTIGMEPGGTGLVGPAQRGHLRVGGGEEVSYLGGSTNVYGNTRSTGEGEVVTLNNMPPYVGVYFIQRTIREYYRAP